MYQTLTSYNMTAGIHILACYVNDITQTGLMNVTYLIIFSMITIASYQIAKRSYGSGDLGVSMTLGSWITLIFGIMMRIVDCPYNPLTSDIAFGVMIAITILSLIVLFFTRD